MSPTENPTPTTTAPAPSSAAPTSTDSGSAPGQSDSGRPTLPPAALDLASKLFDLARSGSPDLLAYVDAGIPPNLTNASGDTLLMLAAYHGHEDTVRGLLARGADPDAVNGKGQAPIAGAVFKMHDGVVRALFEAGADTRAGQPNARDCAVMFKRQDLLQLFESRGW